ncbi:hypothetical protein C4D60_Mb10t01280 [Musa balbisiana]|uniref:Uncharacterized protein n=1 Tax=Musa balbisiana TaxID=52838 RepID=A0A4S8ITU7_MUSBA|nr:hypothetical protein C4D60_Mb10t01280 [Musa balbisiana]
MAAAMSSSSWLIVGISLLLHLRRRPLCPNRLPPSSRPHLRRQRPLFFASSLFNFSTAKDQSSEHRSNFIVVDSLQSCELSSEKAAKTAKYHPWQKNSSSLSIEFFKQSGWSDAQVMKLNQRSPLLLRTNVETVLKPRMRSLKDMGFSDTEIVQLVSSCPSVLLVRDIQPKINFLRSLLGSNEMLLKASKRNLFLLSSSLARKIEPNISLLRECGISDKRIANMLVTGSAIVGRSNKCLKEAIKYVEELGVPCNCKMFPYALSTVTGMSLSRFDATCSTLMNFGFSQSDIIDVFRKQPNVWVFSKENICDKMTFLMKEAGCELTYIISHPVILIYSLEKRLKPRYEILNFLEQNKLLDKVYGLVYVITISEKKFRKKFLFLLREEKSIALYDSYLKSVAP